MTCEQCKYHSYVNGTHFCDSRNHKRKTVRIDDKEILKDIDCKWAESPETCKGCLEPCIMYEPDMRACKKKVTERGE